MNLNVNEEAYFLAEADYFSESPTFYYEMATELCQYVNMNYNEIEHLFNSVKRDRIVPLSVLCKKQRIKEQRFRKHPNPEIVDKLRINGSIAYHLMCSKITEEMELESYQQTLKYVEAINEELEVASKEDRVEIVNKEFWSSYRKRYDEEISRFRMEQNISLQRHLKDT